MASATEPRAGEPVTVVVITWNRREEVLATLPRLLSLPERPHVVVVDNGSSDGTGGAVRSYFTPDRVRVIELDRNLGAAARNVGVAAATTPYVAFADDDSWWDPGALSRAAAVLDAHPRLGLVAARVLVGQERRLDPVCEQMARDSLAPAVPACAGADTLPGPAVLGFLACGAVVRRSAFLDVGGFSELMGVGGEEGLLALDLTDAGWSLAYVPDVVAVHVPSTAARPDRRRRMIRNDLWTWWMRRRFRSAVRLTAGVVLASLRGDPHARGGLLDAAGGLARVLLRRRAVSPAVEARCRLVE
jgi:GT2 family glycosyltransferase